MAAKHPWYRPRHYLHFDPPVGRKRAQTIATNPNKVASHAFYPFISYHVTSKKLTHDAETRKLLKKTKNRPIAYAAHLDSHIYSYYAWELSRLYENALKENSIDECVLAFRSLGKSNVDFAATAFDEIRKRGDCCAVALDFSGFFDNLDHDFLKISWANLLKVERLPADHFAVFKSLTKFSTVNKDGLYDTLGVSQNNPRKGRHRLCEPDTFRKKVRGRGLVKTNTKICGIPQGSPISALLSNIYMIDFDIGMHSVAQKVGGKYYRYCDDMLLILPSEWKDRVEVIVDEKLKELKMGVKLNHKKTEKRVFMENAGVIRSDKPLQYLGFTYDGQHILIRSAALARYSEKMKRGVRFAKATRNKRNRLRIERAESPKRLFRKQIYQRYSHLGKRNFITYGLRSAEIMDSKAIKKQLKPLWVRLIKEIEKSRV